MSDVSGLPRYVRNENTHEVKGVVDAWQASQQLARKPAGAERRPEPRQPPPGVRDKDMRRSAVEGDRRKVCQRIARQPVLVELRSGRNRRRRHLRASDVAEHIDVNA